MRAPLQVTGSMVYVMCFYLTHRVQIQSKVWHGDDLYMNSNDMPTWPIGEESCLRINKEDCRSCVTFFVVELMITKVVGGYYLQVSWNLWISTLEEPRSRYTVPFHSIQQSRITGPSKMLKCHGCHSDFYGVPNSFGNHMTNIEIFSLPAALNCRKFPKNLGMSQQLWKVTKTKFSAGPSHVMGPAELIEMVQY